MDLNDTMKRNIRNGYAEVYRTPSGSEYFICEALDENGKPHIRFHGQYCVYIERGDRLGGTRPFTDLTIAKEFCDIISDPNQGSEFLSSYFEKFEALRKEAKSAGDENLRCYVQEMLYHLYEAELTYQWLGKAMTEGAYK